MLILVEDRSIKDVEAHIKLLLWLNKYKFRTTKVLPTRSGSLIECYFDDKPIFIRAYLEGRVYQNLNKEMLRDLGKEIGKLHQVPPPDFIRDHHFYEREIFSDILVSGVDPAYEAWLTKTIRKIKRQLPENLPSGLIHGDIFMDNVLFKQKKYQAIVDFEQSCYHHFIFDIGMAVIGLCLKNGKIVWNKAMALLEGYQSIRPLLSEEKQNLKRYIVYAAAKTSNWHFWKYHFQSANPNNQARQKELTAIAKDIWKIPDKVFMEAVF